MSVKNDNEDGKDKGFSTMRLCEMWMINRRRIVRWKKKWKEYQNLCDLKPGPKYSLLHLKDDRL